jgi:hypothetical protein
VYASLKNITSDSSTGGGPGEAAPWATKWSDRVWSLYRDAAWHSLNLYGEHTWGADTAANDPQLEDSLAMDNYKKNFAYTARSLSLLLERDAIADLAHLIPRNDQTDLLIFNPLPWERTINGPIPKNVLIPRGLNDDPSSSRPPISGRDAQNQVFMEGWVGCFSLPKCPPSDTQLSAGIH